MYNRYLDWVRSTKRIQSRGGAHRVSAELFPKMVEGVQSVCHEVLHVGGETFVQPKVVPPLSHHNSDKHKRDDDETAQRHKET